MKEALFYKRSKEGKVNCFLCGHNCLIGDGNSGVCGVRKNQHGVLYSLNYGTLIAASPDPIEKKPLYHFYPGSLSYSIACLGCNFNCDFCQNWQISQRDAAEKLGVKGFKLSPKEVVSTAVKNNCTSISYTYTEPTVYLEFASETAKIAKEKGLANIFVTNGYMGKPVLDYISPCLDAANVDLKSFREDFYRKICKASLRPVLENIRLMKELGIWVEITTLVVPGLNDGKKELEDIAEFISSLDRKTPWHISAFHPNYKVQAKRSTPLATLEAAYKIGKDKGLFFVYLGNTSTDYGENTYCPCCRKKVIERLGFSVRKNNLKEGKCVFCQGKVAGSF